MKRAQFAPVVPRSHPQQASDRTRRVQSGSHCGLNCIGRQAVNNQFVHCPNLSWQFTGHLTAQRRTVEVVGAGLQALVLRPHLATRPNYSARKWQDAVAHLTDRTGRSLRGIECRGLIGRQ